VCKLVLNFRDAWHLPEGKNERTRKIVKEEEREQDREREREREK